MDRNSSVGVVIGRFQTPWLHHGHRAVLSTAFNAHENVLVLVGLAPFTPSQNDPLDFNIRAGMIRASFPNVSILPLFDMKEDRDWAEQVDQLIEANYPKAKAIIYGGRDSCLSVYSNYGRHPIQKVTEVENANSTSVRELTKTAAFENNKDFRHGVVRGMQQRYPSVFLVVDCAVFCHGSNGLNVALIRKKNERGWRLPGGFVDGKDTSIAVAAHREVMEETHLNASNFQYVMSMQINDWRLRGKDAMMGVLFTADCIFGPIRAQDDAAEAQWFSVETLPMMEEHHFDLVTEAIFQKTKELALNKEDNNA